MVNEVYHPFESSVICYSEKSVISAPPLDPHPFHRHNAYEIYYFMSGNVNLYIEQQCYNLRPGDLVIISPEQLHRVVYLDYQVYERTIINIKHEYVEKLSSDSTDLTKCFNFNNVDDFKHIHLNRESREEYTSLVNKYKEFREAADYGYDLKADYELTNILIFINKLFENAELSHKENVMPELIKNVMDYVQSHLAETITLEMLANEFYLSGKYISSQFKQHTGLTLRTYILDQRIAFAKRLLQSGANVSEACYRSGFSDYANFIRTFTNLVGISPGKFARENK
ncbi:MAG: helix-turn-helix transcriptional regulator [Oscillospiraceae bacterium]|nr:helix-turn-helix transcriptional regulator [Oscillospiraceae bacterium]